MLKYKSLVYREWKLSSRHYILKFMMVLLFTTLFALALKFAVNSGSMDAVDGVNPSQIAFLVSTLIGLATAIIAAEDNGVHNQDVKVNWARYSYALPITAFEKTVTKYIFKLGAVVLGGVLTYVSSLIVSELIGGSFDINTIVLYILFLDVCMIYELIVQIIVLRARDKDGLKKAKTIAGSIAFLVVFVLPEFIPSDKLDAIDEMESPAELLEVFTMPDWLACCSVLAMLAIFTVGFILTWKSLERREA